MSNVWNNSGLTNFGGTTNVTGSAVGEGATLNVGSPAPQQQGPAPRSGRAWDVGLVTILAEEARAVTAVLGLRDEAGVGGTHFYTGSVETRGQPARVVATRALGQGQLSAMNALANLRQRYDPAVLVLVGIAGAIHGDVAIGDVVVATRVVCYDLRKETPEGTRRRGKEHESPVPVVHAVNSFFNEHGEPARFLSDDPGANRFRVFAGPIGSGEAVVADGGSEIRRYLQVYNDKTLAVDMEAGGLGQFCHEHPSTSGAAQGWLVIRGISDHADSEKDDAQHDSAATNAAHTLREMVPYLRGARTDDEDQPTKR